VIQSTHSKPVDVRSLQRTITQDICNRRGAAFGGVIFGAAIDVCEILTDARLNSTSIQFLRPAMLDQIISYEPSWVESRSSFSCMGLDVAASGRTIATLQARLSEDTERIETSPYTVLPNVNPPEQCEIVRHCNSDDRQSIWNRVEIRRGLIAPDRGRAILWIRSDDLGLGPIAQLAVLSDWGPTAYGELTGSSGKGASVNTTLSAVSARSTEWTMVDFQLLKRDSLCVHMHATLWDQSGSLLGDTFQTFMPIEVA